MVGACYNSGVENGHLCAQRLRASLGKEVGWNRIERGSTNNYLKLWLCPSVEIDA